MKHPWNEAAKLQRNGSPFVWVTMIGTKGYAPQDVGAKALITQDGLVAGTVGGGKVEAKCIQVAQEMLAATETYTAPKTLHWNLQRDVGMSCGGEVTFLFEAIRPSSWRIVVFGAGHVAQRLARILKTLDCQVDWMDSRPEWIARLPKAANIRAVLMDEPKDHVRALKSVYQSSPGLPQPMFVIMTRGHATDVPVLREVLTHFPDAPYFGVIGSKVKAIKIKNEMQAEGFDRSLIDRLHCPMGLPLGGNDPAEIAVSIAAQLIQVRGNESGRAT